ncbi:MAG: DGQHR domain-containing protein, partial [Thermoplasmata archaeon]
RMLIRRKVRDIRDFYRNANEQPLIPGAILLYTPEKLDFKPLENYDTVGNLTEPREKYYIIDGQHRLAGLYFYAKENSENIKNIYVPVMIFDGRQEDFAAEMFVIINSTHTKINKSHLVDLMEKVTFSTSKEKKLAAKVVIGLYEDARSPLRYKINRLGGRSRQEKWILQSELFNEIYKLVNDEKIRKKFGDVSWFDSKITCTVTELFIDWFKAVSNVFSPEWGDKKYMITESVTLKAFVRVLGELLKDNTTFDEWMRDKAPRVFEQKIAKWSNIKNKFRRDGFYERYPAKGQVERVKIIKDDLIRNM